jgi:hypothetical protein
MRYLGPILAGIWSVVNPFSQDSAIATTPSQPDGDAGVHASTATPETGFPAASTTRTRTGTSGPEEIVAAIAGKPPAKQAKQRSKSDMAFLMPGLTTEHPRLFHDLC